eukprot:superscaffoldBa00007790_g22830
MLSKNGIYAWLLAAELQAIKCRARIREQCKETDHQLTGHTDRLLEANMQAVVFLISAVLAAVISSSAGYQFGPLCCSNPTNAIRGSDIFGEGRFGASRGSRKHGGVDIKCEDGSKVYAPLDMTITRQSIPYRYGTKTAINNGIAFTAEGMRFKLWYIRPTKFSGTVRKGDLIGTMLSMQSVYSGITSHVHLEKDPKTDPMHVINTQDTAANRAFCSSRD